VGVSGMRIVESSSWVRGGRTTERAFDRFVIGVEVEL